MAQNFVAVLIGPGPMDSELARCNIAVKIELRWLARQSELNAARVGAGVDQEIVLDLTVTSMPHHIDSRVRIMVPDLGEIRNSRAPPFRIGADQIIGVCGQPLAA